MKIISPRKPIFLVILALAALAVLLALYIINFNPLLLTHSPFKSIGSFEYVRMGESLLDKGLYPKAITYYEKAYESSPDNQEIVSALVFAYSKYAYILSAEEKYDEAIEYLSRAYGLGQSSSAAQNLAIIYSKKALSLARNGQRQKATELFGEARSVAGASYGAAKNLGLSLLNDGLVEFKEDRLDTALLCLKESLSIYRYGKTAAVIADIYYRMGDLRRALFFWRLAKLLSPEDGSVPPKIRRVVKEIKLASSGARDVELEHFELNYKDGLPIDPGIVSSILERAYMDIGKDIGYFPKKKTKIFFYSAEDFKNIFKMHAMVRAFYDGNIRMPVPDGRLGKEELSTYIYHEYTHALLSAKTMNNCPVWFSEGVAMWVDIKRSARKIKDLPVSAETLDKVTLESLDREFNKNEIGPDRAAYYIISYTVVAYIVDTWQVKGLQSVLKRLADGQHVVNAIDDEFLLSEKEFEGRWKAYVRSRVNPTLTAH